MHMYFNMLLLLLLYVCIPKTAQLQRGLMLNVIDKPTALIVIKNPESIGRDQAVSSSLQCFCLPLLLLLPREAVGVQSLTVFKAGLDRALSKSWSTGKSPYPWQRGWE